MTTGPVSLDDTDMALLDELRRDGRVSFEQLGVRVGLSRTATRARVQRLFDTGTVRVETIVHPAVRGHTTFAHVSVTVHGASARETAQRIAALPNAPFVSVVAGRASLIAELRTGGPGELEESISRVRELDGVVRVDTLVYTELVKDSHVPLGDPHTFEVFDLDETDHRLLELLQDDPRSQYSDLAERVGLSRAATRARVLRLLSEGIVVVKGLVKPTAIGISHMCGFGVTISEDAEKVTEQVGRLEAVDFLARTIGRCDLVGTMIARSRNEVSAVLDDIRGLDGVHEVEAWWHLDLVKERYSPQG